MYINRALLKYGYANFALEILEYCPCSELLAKEKHFIDHRPEYNLSDDPSHPFLGRKHTEETKRLMSASGMGKIHSKESIAKMILERQGILKSMEHKNKLSLSNPNSKQIEVLDCETSSITTYHSLGEASRALGLDKSSISKYINRKQKNPLKGRYIITVI